uniref:Uncharacterized protein n=1 Tax=Acartia pacifica TaxID=335913 RepID=A0A0U2T7F6_ACAPC|nr:hypothetical protein [Acartia pacifica]
MSSSSSEDEDAEKLKAALDPSLLTSQLYKTSSEKAPTTSPKKAKPEPDLLSQNGLTSKISASNKRLNCDNSQKNLKSLRRDRAEAESQAAIVSELDVTPEFQAYVARQLDTLLASSIQEIPKHEKNFKNSPSRTRGELH